MPPYNSIDLKLEKKMIGLFHLILLHIQCFLYVDSNIYTLILLSVIRIQGHRAELYAARVAKCLAAIDGRERVNVDDLKKAVSICWFGVP